LEKYGFIYYLKQVSVKYPKIGKILNGVFSLGKKAETRFIVQLILTSLNAINLRYFSISQKGIILAIAENKQVILIALIIIGIQYLLYRVDKYANKYINDFEYYKKSVQKMSKGIIGFSNSLISFQGLPKLTTIKNVRLHFADKSKFEIQAREICNLLLEVIENSKDEFNSIVLFERKKRYHKEYCKILTHANTHTLVPATKNIEHEIGNSGQYSFFIEKIFKENESRIQILKTRNEIEKAFKWESDESKGTTNIQQYICIPIHANNDGTDLVLHIATTGIHKFGKDHLTIENLITNIVKPYCSLLAIFFLKNKLKEKLF
jgi:hypothetical protein